MRAFSYACSLPVTWHRWRLHHSNRRTRKPMLHANSTALCLIELELLPIEVLHCRNRHFRPLWLVWPWPWPDDLHIRSWPVERGDMPHVQTWSSYVKAFESNRLTDIHTDRHDQNYRVYVHHAASRVVNNNKAVSVMTVWFYKKRHVSICISNINFEKQ